MAVNGAWKIPARIPDIPTNVKFEMGKCGQKQNGNLYFGC